MSTPPSLPDSFSRVVCVAQTVDFAKATQIQSTPMAQLLDQLNVNPNLVLIKSAFLGINASDTNFVAGRYDASLKPPYTCGFEAIGTVCRIGSAVKSLKIGSVVGTMAFGAFSEYLVASETALLFVLPTSEPRPEYLGIMVNGLTAWLALHKAAFLQPNDTVLVTGAMGATGQMAVQIAKSHGCTVIGTCGSDKKANELKTLGVDRCINYLNENVSQVLNSEYPQGINVAFEGIGGAMLKAAVTNLANRGRLLIIGAISFYSQEGSMAETWTDAIPTIQLLSKSASAVGFFLNHFVRDIPEAWTWLTTNLVQNKLKVKIDPTQFVGIAQTKDAVIHLHQGRNIGKVVVDVRNVGVTKL